MTTATPSKPRSKTGNKTANTVAKDHQVSVEELRELLSDPSIKPRTPFRPARQEEVAKIMADKAATEPQQPTAVQLVTVQNLLSQLVKLGLRDVKSSYLGFAYPELATGSKIEFATVLSSAFRLKADHDLAVLEALLLKLEEDKVALTKWEPPNPDELMEQGDLYSYTGVCGHPVEASRELVEKRANSHNVKVSPFPRLCPKCLAVRLQLFGMLSFSAQPDDECRVCRKPMFKTGKDGYIDSRSDIYENLLSEVTPPRNLLWRLVPQHSSSHPAHIVRKEQFDRWEAKYRLYIDGQISKFPAQAGEFRAAVDARIAEKRLEFGLLSY